MSLPDIPPPSNRSSLRRVLRWLCLGSVAVITLLVACAWLIVWEMRATAAVRPSSVAGEIWFLFGNVVAIAFVAWLVSKAMRRAIGCPSLTQWFFSWRILRRTLVCLAGFITLVATFYTIENWRGRRAWEQCKRELEAKGEILDWEKFIPPPIPDEQNFFKAPGMTAWFSRNAAQTNQNVRIYSVPKAMSLVTSSGGILEKIRALPDEASETETTRFATSRASLRAAFAEYETEYRLLADACVRPKSRLADNYSVPFNVDIPSFVNARTVAQTLSVHASLSLLDGQPDVAMQDLAMMRRVGEVMDDSHTLVGTMIRVAIEGLYLQTARDALEAGLWKEPQLAALQRQTRDVDLLAGFAQSVRGGERAGAIRALDWPPRELANLFGGRPNTGGIDWPQWFNRIQLELCPRGWIQRNQASLARAAQELLDSLEITSQRVHAARLDAWSERLQNLATSRSPYKFLAAHASPNLVRAVQTVARNQTQLDQLHVACALERYHLARGNYPEKLDALIPAFLDHVPKDHFADSLLKFRRDEKGGYLLWSIGWDEKDDGGVQSLDNDGKPATDTTRGDWVWQSRQP